ncbi:MAG: LicD family protein [Lachnospiraceae bacterium]|nr:LicD family protein [Lachnospiraceae bacterium]
MQFPHTYFEDEVREGFYITGAMKRAWAAQLEVLEEIDKVCRKHNIRWFADCGTLLGAVRHGGYIPWDDDMDICMLRPDYIKFNQVAKQDLPEEFVVLNLNNTEEPYLEYLTRVTNGHRLNFDSDYLEKYHDCPYATGIDIFVLDYIAEDEEEEKERKALATLIMAAGDEIEEDNSNVDGYRDVLNQIEELCLVEFDYTKCIKQQLFQAGEKIFSLYAGKGGSHVALMPYWVYFDNHLYPAEYFNTTVMVPFEITKLPAPAAYDGVLQIEYGDYMKIVKSGGIHDYPFFINQENYLKELISPYPFEYHFSMNDLDLSYRQKKEKPYEAAMQLAGLMEEAHGAFLQVTAARQYTEAVQLLSVCQESAIQVGNLLEERLGEGVTSVAILEQYCELLYQIGELIGQAAEQESAIDIADLEQVLAEITESFRLCVEQSVPKKRVLFLTYKADNWRAFDSVWRKEKEEAGTEVTVVPVPYYLRDAQGAVKEDYYEGAKYPDYLQVQNYQTYDIEKRHPDIIFIQSPYDSYNYTVSVAPQYYSSVIKNYTDKLIYIPWFKADVPSEENQKARKVMDYYCRMPGVVHADLTIVQSEAMRQAYIDYLTEFAGEDTREIWESKIHGDGCPLDDAERYEREQEREEYLRNMPSNWKSMIYRADGSRKKIILYGTNVATLMQHGGATIDKIRRSLKIFEESTEDVVLLWRPHPLFVQAVEKACPERIEEYRSIVRNYQEQTWGIYDNTQDSDCAVYVCDAYYGDSDSLAHKCEVLKKPVMIENVDI